MTSLMLRNPAPLPLSATDSTFGQVLFGIDFGSASLSAARWATANVAVRAHALLAHVAAGVEPDGFEDGMLTRDDGRLQSASVALPGEAKDLALSPQRIRGGLAGFAATLTVPSAKVLVRYGRPSEWLSSIANEADVALLVLGRRVDANRTRIGEPNVIERATRRTKADVLVVPEGFDKPLGHVIAAVDDSPISSKVIAISRWLSRLHEVPLTILYVLSPAVGAYARVMRGVKQMIADRRASEAAALRQRIVDETPPRAPAWLARIGESPEIVRRSRIEVALGDAAREIAKAAGEVNAPLVVVGMRGSDHAPPGSVGSTARELMMRAPCPVLVANSVP